MSDKEKDQFLGFDDSIPCPENYRKYAESSSASQQKHEKLPLSKEKQSSKEHVKKSERKSRKFQSCNKCENCKRPPCGKCRYCLDKLYHGNRSKRKCISRKCVLKSPKNLHTRVQIKEELTEEYDSSSDEEDSFYEDDILDQMLNKLLHEGAHKEALFKDLLVYKYWKLRPEPSPEELVSLANLLNMTMEGIQQILSNSKSDLLSILPKTPKVAEHSVDSSTARKRIMDILKKYPKDTISDLNKSKKLKLEIKRSAAEKTPLHEDMLLLKKLVASDVTGYTHHTIGLFVTVPIWLEGLYLFLTKSDHDLSPLCASRGLRMPKVKKMTQALLTGELPETLVQCLVDHGLSCPKYMNLSFQTLTSWAKHLDKRVEIKQPRILPPTPQTSSDISASDDVKIKREPVESSEPNRTVNIVDSGGSQNSTSRTSIIHVEQTVSSALSSNPSGSCELDDSPKVSVSKGEEDKSKGGSDTESEIGVSEELQSVARVGEDQVSNEADDQCLPGNISAGMPTENVSNCGEKEIESKTDSSSKVGEVSEAVDMAEVDTEDTDSVKTKDDMDAKPAEDTEKRARRYKGLVGKRGKTQPKKQIKKEQTFQKLDGGLVTILWREASMEQVWTEGYFIPTTQYGSSCPELCYLCGSAGLGGFIYCSACAEPFHKYCVDIEDNEVISSDWKCERCIMCHVCSRTTEEMLLKCCECYHTYHGSCLPTDICKVPSKNGIWKCPVCLFCRKCGAKGNSETKWLYDFSVCKPCGKLYSKGNYCPLCEAVYEDEDYDTPMVSCMSCEHWVHIECDNISELEYEAMSNLPEDRVVYVCRRCCRDNVWRQEMMQCVQENLAHCLEAMEGVLDQSKIRLHKYTTVRSIRMFENDVFQYIASTAGAVGTFRTVLNECFPWLSKVKKGIFDVKTPVKTPKKIHWFNKTSTQNKAPQKYESSTFVEKDCRTCVLCNQRGDVSEKGCGRLLVCGVDNWIHVNCALWSSEVFEESDGKLMNVEMAVNRGSSLRCDHCRIYNATVGCCDKQCPRSFHFNCGIKSGAVFLSDKRLYCKHHKEKHRKPHWEHMVQQEFTISRRIYIDPSRIGNTKRNTRPMNSSSLISYVGASRITRLGEVMNISDHPDTLIPIGYTLERLFWSFRDPSYRCRYRCTVVKQIPENPDVFFTDLSDDLLSLDMPFTDWLERTSGTFKPHGEVQFELTITIQKPQLNSFNSDSFAGEKSRIATPNKVKPVKTPVKVRAKIRQPRDEPVINLDGVKVKKSKVRKPRDNQGMRLDRPKANNDDDRQRIKRIHKKGELNSLIAYKVRTDQTGNSAARQEQRNTELQRARHAALELQKQRLRQEEILKVRRYAKLDHTYCMPHRHMESPGVLEYEKHIEAIKVRPGYYIDCISANEGIKSLLQRVGGDDSLRCCGIPYIDPKVVFMFEDAAGKRCIKMAPPVAPKRSPDHEFDAEMPTRGKKLKSVLYKYNKKKKVAGSAAFLHRKTHRHDMKHSQQSSSLYNNNQFKSRVVQQIKAYHVSSGDQKSVESSKTSVTSYHRVFTQLPTTKQMSPTELSKFKRIEVQPTPTLQYSCQPQNAAQLFGVPPQNAAQQFGVPAQNAAQQFGVHRGVQAQSGGMYGSTVMPGNQVRVFSGNSTKHFRVLNSQKKSVSPKEKSIPNESPRKLVIPYVSDIPKFPASRTVPGETPVRSHSTHSTLIISPPKQLLPVSSAPDNVATRDDNDKKFVERPVSTDNEPRIPGVVDTSEGAVQSSSIVIKNVVPSHPAAAQTIKNSSGKVMCVGSRGTSPLTKEATIARPFTSSPARKKVRSEFDVFEFDSEAMEQDDKWKCSSDHYNVLKQREKKYKKKTEDERSRTSSSSGSISLKLSSTTKPSWVVVEGDKGRKYEKIDVDSWLTEREQDQRAQKLLNEKSPFELRGQDDQISHKVTEQAGFSYIGGGGSVTKTVKGPPQLPGPLLTGPPEQYRLAAPLPQPGPRLPQAEQKHRRKSSIEMDQIPKQTSREFLLNEFDAALKKIERAKVPESLTIKNEDEEEEEKQDPRPMVISPTLLTSNKILEKSVQKSAPSKPIILSRATPSTKEVKVSQPPSAEKQLFPGVGNAVTVYRSKRIKHVDKGIGPGGGMKFLVSSGYETAQPAKPKPKTADPGTKNVQPVKNPKNIIAHSQSTVDDHSKEIFPPEYNAGKKVSEAKKTYKMSGSLRELQPKVLTNAPPKSPSPVKELLKDFIKEREIKKTLNFDVEAWKSKVSDVNKPSPMTKPQHNIQNKKILDSFSSYDPPRLPLPKPLSFTETLKSHSVENFNLPAPAQLPPPDSTQHSLLAELHSTVSPEPDLKPTITILQAGYQASPGKVSLQETASILSTSMELCQTYPDPSTSRVSHVATPSLGHVTTPSLGHVTTPSVGHVTTPSLGHVTTPSLGHVTTPSLGHVTTPSLGHMTTPSLGHVATPTVTGIEGRTNMPPPEFTLAGSKSSRFAQDTVTDGQVGLFSKRDNTRNLSSSLLHKPEDISQTKSTSSTNVETSPTNISPANVSNHCLTLPEKNICSRHYINEFLNFQYKRLKIKSEVIDPPLPSVATVKVELDEVEVKKESPSNFRSKRRSAIIASQNLVEKVYKDEDLYQDQVERKNKRKCDRPTIVQSPAKNLSFKQSPAKTPLRMRSVQSSAVKLKLQITQANNRTYIRCKRKERDPSEKTFPVFIVATEDGVYVETDDADDAWTIISTLLQRIRSSKHRSVLHGLAMWTLAHDSVVHIIEQLPNTQRLEEYSFHFPEHGPQRSHMSRVLPVPLGGCARTLPVVRKSYIDQFAFLNHPNRNVKPPSVDDSKLAVAMGDRVNLYSRRTTSLGDLPMAMRYRHIMRTVKEVLCVCPSNIHGRGLYCMQDISMGEMIIEYSGTLIRPGLCDIREKYYDSKGIGSYMFRIDRQEVVDATMSGSMARFINHSCDPNCYSRIINVEGKKKIIIFAERNIVKGEELTYDYKFPSEDVKIPCLCGTEKCRKWMN